MELGGQWAEAEGPAGPASKVASRPPHFVFIWSGVGGKLITEDTHGAECGMVLVWFTGLSEPLANLPNLLVWVFWGSHGAPAKYTAGDGGCTAG